ncbi:2-oxoglutarate dehydrogenase E1 component [Methylomagnum ishizawai]|uniref:2-oxoglutarate dehydrogenase E1 component n=2 Tax=Methylomagnum ishizawai TaxID=1760988 RepID=A0A1Y6D3Q5_9GAMM|nr:2-oxoglutarate dehydrogenase E1 component [Methylomagnum ishizawai]
MGPPHRATRSRPPIEDTQWIFQDGNMNTLKYLFEESSACAEDNVGFLEDLYERFQRDPESVDPSWREKFKSIQEPVRLHPATPPTATMPADIEEALRKQAAVDRLIYHYRTRGHQAADNNPLKLAPPPALPDLDPAHYGLDAADLDRPFYVDIMRGSKKLPLREIIARLKRTYCGAIGSEYMHIVDSEIKQWVRERLETATTWALPDAESQRWLLRMLTAAEGIEKYLHRKYVGQKRFSLEGAESMIPLLDELIQRAGDQGTQEIVIGMAHRGRLNVLINILGKKPGSLFQEFEGTYTSAPPHASAGDVKYHMGFSSDLQTPKGPLHLAMAFNPSHLEIISPVVEGSVRARQDRRDGDGETGVLAVLVHGDAAFAGQGVVMETLNMAETRAYTTGGSIHIVINNQIGFTTSNPFDARSTLYCTDVANMVQAPVFHVNGDDPEAVLFVTQLAVDYRMRFKRDVVIDLICYRRHGHNEADEPAVTQPAMYRFIRQHPPVRRLYAETLIQAGVISREDELGMEEDYQGSLKRDEIVSRPVLPDAASYLKTSWDRYLGAEWSVDYDSTLDLDTARGLAGQIARVPDGFSLHSRTAAVMDSRRKMATGEIPMDWGFAETLAYASLLKEGYNVRISGQDVGRGTFFHRHAVLYDQDNGAAHVPLHHLDGPGGKFHIYDSLLSEEGVLGFEYGYASSEPETLVIWEAQFGDFANNAQVVIDQFITSGETKWGRLCALTMLLPHGYEGQGPEHSSARLERYLQLCAEQNVQVCVPSSPAQIFHLLRRQLVRRYRKPLIVMTPKSLLRHKLAISPLEDLTRGHFHNVIGEIDPHDPDKITRVVLCSGKVFYDLLETRRKEHLEHVALIRIEQLYPFPFDYFLEQLSPFNNLRELVWCQEEPENQGAWHQIKHRFLSLLEKDILLGYAGRPMSAAPAVGQFHRHLEQQKKVVEDALFRAVNPQQSVRIVHAHRSHSP